jgi:hypothetical protein
MVELLDEDINTLLKRDPPHIAYCKERNVPYNFNTLYNQCEGFRKFCAACSELTWDNKLATFEKKKVVYFDDEESHRIDILNNSSMKNNTSNFSANHPMQITHEKPDMTGMFLYFFPVQKNSIDSRLTLTGIQYPELIPLLINDLSLHMAEQFDLVEFIYDRIDTMAHATIKLPYTIDLHDMERNLMYNDYHVTKMQILKYDFLLADETQSNKLRVITLLICEKKICICGCKRNRELELFRFILPFFYWYWYFNIYSKKEK